MNRPRSSMAGKFRLTTIYLPAFACLFLLFADITHVLGQATQSKETTGSQVRRKPVGPREVARPRVILPHAETSDQQQDPDRPTRIDPSSRAQRLFVTVPDLVGRPMDDALRLIRRANLRSGDIRR